MTEREEARVVVVAHREATVRQIVQEALESRGVEVKATAGGEEAISLVLERHPAAVLVSLELETLDGWKVLAAVRDAGLEDTIVVALTADARAITRQRALERGFTSYLALPVPPFELLRHLEELGLNGSN